MTNSTNHRPDGLVAAWLGIVRRRWAWGLGVFAVVVGKQSWARENLPAFIGAFTAVAVAVITGLLVR